MKPESTHVIITAVILVIIALLAAGCMSIPGPGDTTTTPAVAPPAATPAQAPATLEPVVRTITANPVPVTTTPAPGYETATCAAQGGTIVSPGEKCTGSYLPATDSFSCCSKNPVAIGNGNVTAAIPSFDLSLNLSLNLDDNTGSITP